MAVRGGAATAEQAWRDDVRRFAVPPAAVTAFVAVPLVGVAVLLVLRVTSRSVFDVLVREDSVLEWSTVVAFLACATAAARSGRRLWRDGLRWQGLLWAGLALACVVAAGEEISWGERVLPIEGSTALQERNLQDETTVHNLEGVYSAYVLLLFVVGVYGSVGSWFAKCAPRLRTVPDVHLFVPPLFLTVPFATMAAYRIARLRLDLIGVGEWVELCVAVALALFGWLTWRRLGAPAVAAAPVSAARRPATVR